LFSEFLRILLRIPTSSATIIKAISKVVSQDMTRRTHHKLSADEIDASELTLMLGGFKLLHGLAKSHGFGHHFNIDNHNKNEVEREL